MTTCDTGAMCAGVRLSHDWQAVRHGEAWHRWALCTPCTHPVHPVHPVHWSPSRTSWDRQSFTRVQSSLTQCPLRRRTPCHLHLAAALLDNVPLYIITVHCAPDTRHGTHIIMETPSPGPRSQPRNIVRFLAAPQDIINYIYQHQNRNKYFSLTEISTITPDPLLSQWI